MNWKTFKGMIKNCRRLSNKMNRLYKHETMFWLEPQITFKGTIERELIFQLNPYCCNLKTGEYEISCRNSLTGKYCKVPNLKTCNEVN